LLTLKVEKQGEFIVVVIHIGVLGKWFFFPDDLRPFGVQKVDGDLVHPRADDLKLFFAVRVKTLTHYERVGGGEEAIILRMTIHY
jgi:hypothetical protein